MAPTGRSSIRGAFDCSAVELINGPYCETTTGACAAPRSEEPEKPVAAYTGATPRMPDVTSTVKVVGEPADETEQCRERYANNYGGELLHLRPFIAV